jgi:hypothetical protein
VVANWTFSIEISCDFATCISPARLIKSNMHVTNTLECLLMFILTAIPYIFNYCNVATQALTLA